MYDLETLAKVTSEICRVKGWDREWDRGGCYLHLEASEFIEALRGKGDSSREEEAADVLFVLLSLIDGNGIDVNVVIGHLYDKIVTMIAEEILFNKKQLLTWEECGGGPDFSTWAQARLKNVYNIEYFRFQADVINRIKDIEDEADKNV